MKIKRLLTRRLDLAGKRFGRLVVLSITPERLNGQRVWLCRCDCGGLITVRAFSLREGETQSCGCLRRQFAKSIQIAGTRAQAAKKLIDMAGQVFSSLTVLRRLESEGHGALWLCQCACGVQTEVLRTNLIRGLVRSCGCRIASLSVQAQRLQTRHYPHLPAADITHYLTMKRATRKVEQCLTQTK